MEKKFEFKPVNGYMDSAAFPNPQGEETTREMLQRLHNQTRDFINELIDAINAYNIENKVTSESVKYLRVADGNVQWSVDNETWFSLGGGGTGGSAIPGGGQENQVLARGASEFTARWDDIVNLVGIASEEKNGLLSAEDKSLLNKVKVITENGEAVSAEYVQETQLKTFLKNTERAKLFDEEGDALFYSTNEVEQLFQKKIAYGTELPEEAEEGDIFLLIEAPQEGEE